jgi:hypothetical protein
MKINYSSAKNKSWYKKHIFSLFVGTAVTLLIFSTGIAREPNSTLINIPGNTWLSVSQGAPTDPGIMSYSGMVYDSKHHKLLLFGGGHWDYWGNEVVAFDIDTLTWKRMYEPVAEDGYAGNFDNNNFPGMLLDTRRPMSRHTYDQMEFIDPPGVLFQFNGYTWGDSGTPWCFMCDDSWAYDLSTNSWTYKNAARNPIPDGEGASSAYDSSSGLLIAVSRDETWVYDYSQDLWQRRYPSGSPPGSIETVMEYDSKRKIVYLFGGSYPDTNSLWKYSVTENKWTELRPSGTIPPARGHYGLAYDSANDVLIAFGGGSQTWVYLPASNKWVKQAPTTGNPNAPSSTFSRLRYDPVNNVTFLVSYGNGGVETWAYKYSASDVSSGPPSPPKNLRLVENF